MMPVRSSKKRPPRISLFDVFIGTGRTIRKSKGPPGLPLLQTNNVNVDRSANEMTKSDNKTQDSKSKPGDRNGKFGNDGNAKEKTQEDKTAGNKIKDNSNMPGDAFTPEQDAKLQEMKATNKTWKQIEDEIGKPKHIAQKRFKELQARDEGAETMGNDTTKENNKDKKAEEDKPKGEAGQTQTTKQKAQEWKDKNQQQGKQQHKQNNDGDGDKNKETTKKGVEPRFTLSQLRRLEDSQFSLADLQVLIGIAGIGTSPDWDAVASRFFDFSGRRIDGMDIKEKFKVLEAICGE